MQRLTRRGFLAGLLGLAGALAAGAERALAAAGSFQAICRAAWGARSPTGSFRRHRIRRLTVHHSAVALLDNRKAPARFRSHQAAHQAKGWPDIAYHILIDRHGNVYRGRPISAVGDTATEYDPTGHLLVMCEGNFDEQAPSKAQVAALVDVLAWACTRYDVRPRTIRGHRDWAQTACPGKRLHRLIADGTIRRRVRARLDAGGVALERLCGDEGGTRVGAIEAGTD